MRLLLLFVCSFLIATGSADADELLFNYSGVVPNGADIDGNGVTVGESWNANFVVSQVTGEVTSGNIEFSGGESLIYNTTGWEVTIFNDIDIFNDGSIFVDAVRMEGFDSALQRFQAQAEFAAAPGGPLVSASLADLDGVLIDSAGSDSLAYAQLRYEGATTVVYSTLIESNVVLTVSKVPEPSSTIALSVLASAFCRRRRK